MKPHREKLQKQTQGGFSGRAYLEQYGNYRSYPAQVGEKTNEEKKEESITQPPTSGSNQNSQK